MDDNHIKEASAVAAYIAGFSAYLYGIDYDRDQHLGDLEKIVEHIKKQNA